MCIRDEKGRFKESDDVDKSLAQDVQKSAKTKVEGVDQVLSERLDIATSAVLDVEGRSARAIFGSPDDVKFHSSMTLFSEATGDARPLFRPALDSISGQSPTRKRPVSSVGGSKQPCPGGVASEEPLTCRCVLT